MLTLGMDTSSASLNLALVEDKKILGKITLNGEKNHSVTLMPALENLMATLQLKPAALQKIVVTQGPGSYTGLRIGVTLAKTLAWTLKTDLVGISTIEALAAYKKEAGLVVPLMDARRDNVYTGLYERKDDKLQVVIADFHTSFTTWLETLKELQQPLLFLGETEKFAERIQAAGFKVNAFPETDLIDAAALAFLGAEQPGVLDIHQFVPAYLKLVEAEEKWQKAHPGETHENYVEKV